MDRYSRQKTSKKTENRQALNDTLDQMDLISIFRTFHPKAAEYTNFAMYNAHPCFGPKLLGKKYFVLIFNPIIYLFILRYLFFVL